MTAQHRKFQVKLGAIMDKQAETMDSMGDQLKAMQDQLLVMQDQFTVVVQATGQGGRKDRGR